MLKQLATAPLLAALFSCSGNGGAEEVPFDDSVLSPISERALLHEDWGMVVAFEGDARINGVACGELDLNAPGDEIASVDRHGNLRLHRRTEDGFEQIELPREIPLEGEVGLDEPGGELVQVAVGDLDPASPGDEIVAVGMARGGEDDGGAGLVRYFARRGPGGALVEQRFVTPALVHAITVGDVLPERPGLEFLFAGAFGEAFIGHIEPESGSLLVDVTGATHDGIAKGATLMGDGFVLACDDGQTLRYGRDQLLWKRERVVQHGTALARITAMDIPKFMGASGARGSGGEARSDAYVVCGNDGTFRLCRATGAGDEDTDEGTGGASAIETTFLVRAENRLRGALLVDVDPGSEGPEACTAGYDGEIRVVALGVESSAAGSLPAVTANPYSVARDTAKIHHLAAGEFRGLGTCLVSCGYSGDILVVCRGQ